MIEPIQTPALTASDVGPMRVAAQKLESEFIYEMLKPGGLARTSSAFGGGAGEEQYTSLLLRAQADLIAENGGIGLAEHLFHALSGTFSA